MFPQIWMAGITEHHARPELKAKNTQFEVFFMVLLVPAQEKREKKKKNPKKTKNLKKNEKPYEKIDIDIS